MVYSSCSWPPFGTYRSGPRNNRLGVGEKFLHRVRGRVGHADIPCVSTQPEDSGGLGLIAQTSRPVAHFIEGAGQTSILRLVSPDAVDLYEHLHSESGFLIGGRDRRRIGLQRCGGKGPEPNRNESQDGWDHGMQPSLFLRRRSRSVSSLIATCLVLQDVGQYVAVL